MSFNPFYNSEQLKERRQWLRRKATYSEKVLWQDLRNRKMSGAKFYRQFSIGSFVFDFYCPEVHLAIELDGATHTLRFVQANDQRKTSFLEQNNIALLRFSDEELLKNYGSSLKQIELAVTLFREKSKLFCNKL